MTIVRVEISEINLKHTKTQTRCGIDRSAINAYSEVWLSSDEDFTFDSSGPIVLFCGGGMHIIADGWHRILAAVKVGRTSIMARVEDGDETDALWFAAGANRNHGVRRTRKDTRKAIAAAVSAFPGMADYAIALHVGVSPHTVKIVRDGVKEKRVGAIATVQKQLGDGHRLANITVPTGLPQELSSVAREVASELAESKVETVDEGILEAFAILSSKLDDRYILFLRHYGEPKKYHHNVAAKLQEAYDEFMEWRKIS